MTKIIIKFAKKSQIFPTFYLFLLIIGVFLISGDSFNTKIINNEVKFKFQTYLENNPILEKKVVIDDIGSNNLNINILENISNIHCYNYSDYSVCENYSENILTINDVFENSNPTLSRFIHSRSIFELDLGVAINNTKLPTNLDKKVKNTKYTTLTAYNSEVAQCDESPCITATGFNLCTHDTEDSIAANFLPFGATVKIPEVFGDKTFVVRDRMNSRYYNRIDVWMKDKSDAKKFGIKRARVEVLE